MPPRRASAGEWATRVWPRTLIVPPIRPDGAGQDLDERALAGAVGAHQRVDLAGPHGQRRGLERDDGAVRLGDAGGFEQQIGGGGVSSVPVERY